MEADRKSKLLEEAAERYNSAQYEEAMALWREVLAEEPSNQKAREGIRMASLLTTDWASPAPTAEDAGPAAAVDPRPQEIRARVEAGIARVKELAAAGQVDRALEGCELLAGIAPDDVAVIRLIGQIRGDTGSAAPSSPTGDIEQHLAVAREALADGRNRQAAEAARKALGIDPSNMEACGILSMAADDDMAAEPVAIGVKEETAEPAAGNPGFDTGKVLFADVEPDSEPGEDRDKVQLLLAQGRKALAEGRPEAAIEVWSRVFALDRHNAEAGALIDQAKGAIEEQGRRVDEIFYRAVDANEAGRGEEALALFHQVLAIAPTHHEARAAIDEIKARQAGPDDGIGIDPAAAREVVREKRRGLLSVEADNEAVAGLFKEPASVPLADPDALNLFPPRISTAAVRQVPVRPAIIRARRSGGAGRIVVGAAGAVLVAAVGVAAWLWFGSGTGSMPAAEATIPVPVTSAARPAGAPGRGPAGKTAPIEVVPGAQPKKEAPAPAPAPLSPEQLKAQAAELTRQGREYYQQQRWVESVLAFKKALSTDPIDFDAQDLLEKAMARLESEATLERETAQATKLFGEGDYASALHKFYRLQEDHPDMKVLDVYIANSWYNWGVTLLQAGAVDEAVEKFDEVLQIDARDAQATRAREIGKRYHGRPRDAVFDAFANALPLRTLEQR